MLKSPFPYFGGKSRAAHIIWNRFGDVPNYVEPFAGSCAVLLARPHEPKTETVNDADGLLSNFWRALKHDPEAVIEHADWPVNEADLHARHFWLVGQRDALTERLMGDPDWYDPKAAGWWVWGVCAWIGGGWCSGVGPWVSEAGRLVKRNPGQGIIRSMPHLSSPGQGINRQMPHLSDPGQGITRKMPHLGGGRGINRKMPHLSDPGQGINRQMPHLGGPGRGINRKMPHLGSERGPRAVLAPIAHRIRWVRVVCGDWWRVLGPAPTHKQGLTGVFLDPPYHENTGRSMRCYAIEATHLSDEVREWAIENGENPLLRIALCGYESEHQMPDDWECVAWKAQGGYGRGNGNAERERVWFSPHCLKTEELQLSLFSHPNDPTRLWEVG